MEEDCSQRHGFDLAKEGKREMCKNIHKKLCSVKVVIQIQRFFSLKLKSVGVEIPLKGRLLEEAQI